MEILLSPSEGNIRPNDPVTLTCLVNSSYPKVNSVQWVKDGVRLETQSRMLQLSQAAWEDAGVYTCQAENSVGSSVSLPVSLHIFSESWMSLGLEDGSWPGGQRGARPRCLLGRGYGVPAWLHTDDKPPWQGGMSGGSW